MIIKNNSMLGEMRRFTLQGRNSWTGLAFVSPWILGAALFFVYPISRTLILSMSEIVNLRTFELKFVGIQWYYDVFAVDIGYLPRLMTTGINNLINLPIINIFALIAALLLNRNIKARGFFRSMFFLPVLLGTGFILQQLLGQNVNEGVMSFSRGMIFPEQLQHYLGSTVMGVIQGLLNRLTVVMWSSGVQILIFLSALQGISPSIYEAARADSAGEWEQFWLITLPMLAPMIQLNLVYTVLDTFTMADNSALEYIQNLAFNSASPYHYEYSCMIAVIYTLFVLAIVGVLFLITRRFVNDLKESN